MDEKRNPNTKKRNIIINYTEGNIPRQLLVFAAPLFLSSLLQIVYNIVDMLIVGQSLGSVGLSAISVGGDVSNMMAFLAMGFSGAGQVIIAQYIGAKKEDRISGFVGSMFTFLIACAIVISVLVFLGRQLILGWMNTPAEAWDNALAYMTICSIGMVFIYGYNILCAILRGFGDSRHPFMFIAFASVLNVFLDLLFVMRFGLGAGGAALATVISQATSFVWGIIFLYRNREKMHLDFSVRSFIPRWEHLSVLIKLGVPMAINSAAVQFSKLFLNSFINSYGLVVSAVTGVANKMNMIVSTVGSSATTAGSTMIGQNIGAEKYKRVARIVLTTFVVNICIMAVFIILVTAIPEQIFMLFTSDSSILPVAMKFVPIFVILCLGSACRSPMNALLNGSGNYRLTFICAILDGFVFRIGLGLLFGLAMHMDYVGFWLGDAVAGFTPVVVGGIYLLSGKWKTRKFVIRD